MKKCTKCTQEKELDQFHNSKATKDGKVTICKECAKNFPSQTKEANLKRVNKYRAVSRDKYLAGLERNREKTNERARKNYYKNREANQQRTKDRYWGNICENRVKYREYMKEYFKSPENKKKRQLAQKKFTDKNKINKSKHKIVNIRYCYADKKYSKQIIPDKEKLITEINSLLQPGMTKDNFQKVWTIRIKDNGTLYTDWKIKPCY